MNYDLSTLMRNPYAGRFGNVNRNRIVLINDNVLSYFRDLAKEKGEYQGDLITEVLRKYIIEQERQEKI